jgi:hypothetical protein
MDRRSKASLSPREFAASRTLKQGFRDIPDYNRRLLLSMGLAVDDGEAIKLSLAGLSRLDMEVRAS